MGVGILTDQNQPNITPEEKEGEWLSGPADRAVEEKRARLSGQALDRAVEFIKRRPFAAASIILLLLLALVLIPGLTLLLGGIGMLIYIAASVIKKRQAEGASQQKLTDRWDDGLVLEGRAGLDRIVGILSRYRVAFFILLLAVLGLASHSGSGPSDSGSAPSVTNTDSAIQAPTAAASEASANQMKLKYFWVYQWARFEGCRSAACRLYVKPFFDCDYTTLTCRRGFQYQDTASIWVTLADDRKTELAHSWCSPMGACLSFDTGEVTDNVNRRIVLTLTQDIPEDCVTPKIRNCEQYVSSFQSNNPFFLNFLRIPPVGL